MYLLIAVWVLCMALVILLLHLRRQYRVRDDAWVLRNSRENQVTDRRVEPASAATVSSRHRTAYRVVRDVLLLAAVVLTGITIAWVVNAHPAGAPYLATSSRSVTVDTRLLAGCVSIFCFWGLWLTLILCGRYILAREQSVLETAGFPDGPDSKADSDPALPLTS